MPSELPCVSGDTPADDAGTSNSTATFVYTEAPNVKMEGKAVYINQITWTSTGGTTPCGMLTPTTPTSAASMMAGGSSNVKINGMKIMIKGDQSESGESGFNGTVQTPVACTSTHACTAVSSITKVKIS